MPANESFIQAIKDLNAIQRDIGDTLICKEVSFSCSCGGVTDFHYVSYTLAGIRCDGIMVYLFRTTKQDVSAPCPKCGRPVSADYLEIPCDGSANMQVFRETDKPYDKMYLTSHGKDVW